MFKKIVAFHKDENGGLVENAIIISILAVLAVGAYTFLGPKIKNLINKTGQELDKGSSYTY